MTFTGDIRITMPGASDPKVVAKEAFGRFSRELGLREGVKVIATVALCCPHLSGVFDPDQFVVIVNCRDYPRKARRPDPGTPPVVDRFDRKQLATTATS